MHIFCLNFTAECSIDIFQSHNTSHKIFSNTIKIHLLFIDTTTNTTHKVINFICLCNREGMVHPTSIIGLYPEMATVVFFIFLSSVAKLDLGGKVIS